ncbi:hypothetical protein AB0C51_07395 [Streptomyces pathocidini]|uniref:hypothetical protein n=1 Tax=Streptomyces pathocidini TaxID=1650571 RepID=UPI0033CCEF36
MDANAVPQQTEAPIYSAMVERWAAAGRAVPGRYDSEWTTLIRRPAWPAEHRDALPSAPAAPARRSPSRHTEAHDLR